ncbi:MAG TPA: hypothetical protein VGV89_09270 [Thermoplasmata archaeon]|nr:hypothetical protein [Thermoplasmata archaeon]
MATTADAILADTEALNEYARWRLDGVADHLDNVRTRVQRAISQIDHPEDLRAHLEKALEILDGAESLRGDAAKAARSFVELQEARSAEAKLNAQVLDAWPDETVAKTLMYIGAGLIGSAGVTAAIEQSLLPIHFLAGYYIALVVGGALFLSGFGFLWSDQHQKWQFFGNRMRVFYPANRFWRIKVRS